jgi:UDP-N-acetyl-D-galactosamine dehydrogenase
MINKKYKVAIIGLGYVGLGLAIEFSKISKITGFDKSNKRITDLKNGKDTNLLFSKKELDKKKINFTNTVEDLKKCNFFIICVPTPVTKNKKPLLKPLIESSKLIGAILKKKDIVVYESTVYPGCTEEICIPILEKFSKLRINKDFLCGYSPERINPGDKINKLRNIIKVVSGTSNKSTNIIASMYSKIIKAGIHKAPNIKTAEAAKALENTQRSVNISLINEVSVLFNKLNIKTSEVLEAANTKWNFNYFVPGLVGGHCIAIDPYYLVYKAKQFGLKSKLIIGSQKINEEMPVIICERFMKSLLKKKIKSKKKNVLIMGLTFKENCSDIRESKVFDIINYLTKKKINVKTYDPWVNKEDLDKKLKINHIKNFKTKSNFDGVIIAVRHDVFKKIGIKKIKSFCKKNSVIFDIKNQFHSKHVDETL